MGISSQATLFAKDERKIYRYFIISYLYCSNDADISIVMVPLLGLVRQHIYFLVARSKEVDSGSLLYCPSH